MTTYLLIRCSSCGMTMHTPTTHGNVISAPVRHETSCAFFRALDKSPSAGRKWVAKHGYPISVSLVEVA